MVIDLLDDVLDLGPRAKGTDPEAVVREERAKRNVLPESNTSLRDWDKPAAAEGETCHADDRPAKHQCKQCGRGACAQHYWVMFGLCRACASQDRVSRFHQEKAPEGSNWLDD